MQSQVLDPVTHSQLRTEFKLPASNAIFSDIRLGGVSAINTAANVTLNTASGYFSAIQTLSLQIAGQTVCELRNAHVYLAYKAASGSADDGDSAAEKLSFSVQRFMPYLHRDAGDLGDTLINVGEMTIPRTPATAQSSHLYLKDCLPFLQAMPFLNTNMLGDVRIIVEYVYDLHNISPLTTGGEEATNVISRPYLMFESSVVDMGLSNTIEPTTKVIEFTAIESDMLQIPAVADAATQAVSAQSRAFVGKSVSSVLFCKTTQAFADSNSGGMDASFAQKDEVIRVGVDGKQVTPLLASTSTSMAYALDSRAPVIQQKYLFQDYQRMLSVPTQRMVGARHWPLVPIDTIVTQSMSIDYSRTGAEMGGNYPPGIAALNLYMFAGVKRVMRMKAMGGGVVRMEISYA